MRKLAVAAISVALVVVLAAPAVADPIRVLTRRVNRLENRVARVENVLGGFIGFFFECIVPSGAAVSIVGSDGAASTGVALYVDTRCLTAAASPDALERAVRSRIPR